MMFWGSFWFTLWNSFNFTDIASVPISNFSFRASTVRTAALTGVSFTWLSFLRSLVYMKCWLFFVLFLAKVFPSLVFYSLHFLKQNNSRDILLLSSEGAGREGAVREGSDTAVTDVLAESKSPALGFLLFLQIHSGASLSSRPNIFSTKIFFVELPCLQLLQSSIESPF